MRAKTEVLLLASAVTLVLGIGSPAVAQQPSQPVVYTSVLVTKRMCCAHESVPAIREMSKIPGVARVVADHKTRSLTIVPKANVVPSPLAIWEAAERTKLEPVRLSTPQGVFDTKPKVRR
jgi:hypothetical protein